MCFPLMVWSIHNSFLFQPLTSCIHPPYFSINNILHFLYFIHQLQNTMANPPPVRPWFRLGSIRSGPAPAPAPAPAPVPAPVPEPRPILSLPQFRTASAPPSPQIQPTQPQEPAVVPVPSRPAPSSSSLPTSPIQKPAVTNISSVPSSPSPKPTPNQSPTTFKAPVQSPIRSPKTQTSAPPPSPFTLPPSQMKSAPQIPMEPEPKTVLVQKTVDKPNQWMNGNGERHRETGETRNHGNSHHGKHVVGKESEAKEKGIHRKILDSDDTGMRVITIAGENRGAYMELIQSQKKHGPNYLHKKGHSETNGEVVESEGSSSEEGKSSRKDKSQKGRTASSFPMAAYMNSNVQCVNNSLLFHTSCSHHDPGVRLSLSKKPLGEGYNIKEHVDGQKS